ncbi:MAG: Crp/Fnr family transcriptional regulator [Anaerolineales bacterium]|nr:Crp/Fnr family transcriptional regulator [Anaerolineales bacterium]
MNRLADLLKTVEVFEQLTDGEREELAHLAVRRSLEKEEIICLQEDIWPYVIYIAHGSLRSVINAPDGRNYVVSSWNKGEIFWAHTIFDHDPMPSTLTTNIATNIYQWEGEKAFNIVLRNQNAVRALLRRQTLLIRKRRESIYNLAFNPVASRLAKLIMEKFFTTDEPTVQRDLTLSEMAEMVASSPEVVCRLLYQFQAAGSITISRATITLHDREALRKLVSPDQ